MECMRFENDIVDAGIDNEPVVSNPMLWQSNVDRPSWKSNTVLHLDMPSVEFGVMHAYEYMESLENVRTLSFY